MVQLLILWIEIMTSFPVQLLFHQKSNFTPEKSHAYRASI